MGASGELRVGILVDRWEPERGGAERCLAQLARHLEARGHEVLAIAAAATPGAPGRFQRVRVPGKLGGLRRVPHERALARGLVDTAADLACDVTIGIRHLRRVDLYWPHGGSHLRSLEARARARGRALSPPRRGRHALFLELEEELLARGGAGRVLCVSELVERELAELYPGARERLVRVPNGVDLERFHPRNREESGARLRSTLGVAPDERLLVFAGHDPELKGLAPLLAALGRLAGGRWRLLVAGLTSSVGRWRSESRRLGLEDHVRFAGRLEAAALFAAGDLVCVPTWRDTASLVLLESLASGTPVVTSRYAGEAPTVAGDDAGQDAGTVVDDPGDVDALASAVERWLARLEAGEPPREAVREAVLDRGLAPWLERLEGEVRRAAGR